MIRVIVLIIVSILMTNFSYAEVPLKKDHSSQFEDKIKSYKESDSGLVVRFVRHAALYKIEKSNPLFEKLKTQIDQVIKEKKRVQIRYTSPEMQILEINE